MLVNNRSIQLDSNLSNWIAGLDTFATKSSFVAAKLYVLLALTLRQISLILTLTLILTSCGFVNQPKVDFTNYTAAGYKHIGTETTCISCHASDRPTDINTPSTWVDTFQIPFDYSTHGGALDCATCHTPQTGLPNWSMWSSGNYVHPSVLTSCSSCHLSQRPDLQVPPIPPSVAQLNGFDHSVSGTGECLGCHQATLTRGSFADATLGGDWSGAAAAGTRQYDPASDITNLASTTPTFSGTTITSVTANTNTLHMAMNHSTNQVPAGWINTNCSACHADVAVGAYRPGVFHASLISQGIAQPAQCSECHNSALLDAPTDFVGSPPASGQTYSRSPSSASMRHNAVVWSGNPLAPTTTPTVIYDCSVCHTAPASAALNYGAWWGVQKGSLSPANGQHAALYHESLGRAGLSQPASCIDCHGNSRPTAAVGIQNYTHSNSGMGNCATCHSKGVAQTPPVWTGGEYHLAGSANPTTCLPCHSSERPTSTSSPIVWSSSTYSAKPFDYGSGSPNVASGNTHGANQDCALCHAGPGTGSWGSSQNWVNGNFNHKGSGASLIANNCISCHSSQRPDKNGYTVVTQFPLSFDHSVNGTGDCLGCHGNTVTMNVFSKFLPSPANTSLALNTATSSDWYGGLGYPGSNPIASGANSVTVTQYSLNGSPVTSVTTNNNVTLLDSMVHTAAGIPTTPVNLKPTGASDTTTCVRCHTSASVTRAGIFHPGVVAAGDTVSNQCASCHASSTIPSGIVEHAGSYLQPMDHSATFAAPVTLTVNGVSKSVSSVAAMDCSNCHTHPGVYATNPSISPPVGAWPTANATTGSWKDGTFHANIGAANPSSCVMCHYMTMANTATSDKVIADGEFPATPTYNGSPMTIKMVHGSTQVATQSCATCHTSAIAASTTNPSVSTSWAGGLYHSKITTQPTSACTDCHTSTVPTVTVTHASTYAPNGALTTPSQTLYNDISHTQFGATVQCSICHTSTANSNLWTTGIYHNSTTYKALTTPPACVTCHASTKPTSIVTTSDVSPTTFDHSTIGTADCNACHSYPGKAVTTGVNSKAAPNWLGASAAPTVIAYPGQAGSEKATADMVNSTLAGNATTAMKMIGTATTATLKHPTVGSTACSVCHTAGAYPYLQATHYDHGAGVAAVTSLISNSCASCHEAGSNTMVASQWSSATGAGDTRPVGMTTLTVQGYKPGACVITGASSGVAKHFYPTDCGACHATPGVATSNPPYIVGSSTGAVTGSTSPWAFTSKKHKPSGVTCALCHVGSCPN
jgi:hypothetical protein